jgi:hypothetical protein
MVKAVPITIGMQLPLSRYSLLPLLRIFAKADNKAKQAYAG